MIFENHANLFKYFKGDAKDQKYEEFYNKFEKY